MNFDRQGRVDEYSDLHLVSKRGLTFEVSGVPKARPLERGVRHQFATLESAGFGCMKLVAVSRRGKSSRGTPRLRRIQGSCMALRARLLIALSAPNGDQFGNFFSDYRHRVFRCIKAASRSEHGADIAERCVRSAMHDGNETVTLQKGRK